MSRSIGEALQRETCIGDLDAMALADMETCRVYLRLAHTALTIEQIDNAPYPYTTINHTP
jgi:hypothetical protein